jgi:anti-anti-sigma factor
LLRGRLEHQDGRAVYALSGEIGLSSGAALEERVSGAFGAPSGDLVLDLDDVYFIDSSGLLALIRVKRAIEAYGGRLVLRRVNSFARTLLETTELAENFEI